MIDLVSIRVDDRPEIIGVTIDDQNDVVAVAVDDRPEVISVTVGTAMLPIESGAGALLRMEFAFSNLLTQVFRHNWGLTPSVAIIDSSGRQISLAVEHIYETGSTLTDELRLRSNQPISGKLILQL